MTTLRIGTRGSDLALAQADLVVRALRHAAPGWAFDVVVIRTTGDAIEAGPAWRADEPGLFTSELQRALVAGAIDAAVHSLKDLPVELNQTRVAACLERADPSDVVVSRGPTLSGLSPGARIGTSSLRRRSQVIACRHDLDVCDIRGAIPTRLAAVDRGEYDAIVIARAGLTRLRLEGRITEVLPLDTWLPAPGQGAIAVEVVLGTSELAAVLATIDHGATTLATMAERSFMSALGAGCRAPVAAFGRFVDAGFQLDGLVGVPGTGRMLRGLVQGDGQSPEAAIRMGRQLAARLFDAGAQSLLDESRERPDG